MAKYAKEEKVLCKHGLCTYPAKILDVEESDQTCKYLVHYQGWNPKWDEWIQDDRIDKFTEEKAKEAIEENKQILERLKKKKSSSGAGTKASKATAAESDLASVSSSAAELKEGDTAATGSRASSPSANSVVSSSTAGGDSVSGKTSAVKKSRKSTARIEDESALDTKRKRAGRQNDVTATSTSNLQPAPFSLSAAVAASVQSEQDYLNKPEVSIKIPEELRPLLVDDWDLVIKQMKLVSLPAKPTVARIFEDYIREKKTVRNISPAKLSSIVESAEGLCAYFDVMLPSQLLYKFEKPQYDELFQKSADMLASEFYGFPHLLRLFVRLGYMLACTGLDERNMALVLANVADFLKFLKKIKPTNMALEYETASPEYQRLAYS